MYLISEGRKSVWREFYDTGISGGKPPSDTIKSAFAQAKGFLHYELRITNYEFDNKKPSLYDRDGDFRGTTLLGIGRPCPLMPCNGGMPSGPWGASLSDPPLGGEGHRLSDRLAPHGGSLHGLGGEIPRHRVSHNRIIIVQFRKNVK